MGFSFRKRLKICKGVHLNFSKNGISTSIGPKGAKLNFSSKGTRFTASIPGTGIRYTEKLNSKKVAEEEVYSYASTSLPNFTQKFVTPPFPHYPKLAFGIIFFGFINPYLLIPCLFVSAFLYFGIHKKEEKEYEKQLFERDQENRKIRLKLEELNEKAEALDILIEIKDYDEALKVSEEAGEIFNEISKYAIYDHFDADKLLKNAARIHSKVGNQREVISLTIAVIKKGDDTKEMKILLAKALKEINSPFKIEEVLREIATSTNAEIQEYIQKLIK
ncbi:hypothetical protein A2U11_10100 [Fusobacterium necrophorum subsp. funduliforme]|uniref:DUF4236 domain-containing protein n=1 Tax=Fusobacterium necrophorum TaxID=859 RepID=UPI000787A4F0|nr:DUF4236 domain-containing protein [Fusobacterium necrophorum]KYM49765.1 hypothetical protein A2U11_10100 [Fusobacterium necrophorum subsp. funduliforme]